jgi:hypothetical protein
MKLMQFDCAGVKMFNEGEVKSINYIIELRQIKSA